LGLAAITLALYWPVAGHDFINLDDPIYVYENPHVLHGLSREGVAWAFGRLTGEQTYWHPVTWLSLMLDSQLFGTGAGSFHLVNALFHAANAALLFWVLRRMTGACWRSALVAALFAWHPLQVDSVAWVAERKNVLSTFFWLLTLWAYACYVERAAVRGQGSVVGRQESGAAPHATRHTPHATGLAPRAWPYYGLMLACFALGLMCKPMLVTVPVVLLLLDVWPLRRFSFPRVHRSAHPPIQPAANPSPHSPALRLFLEKAPLFMLSAASAAITVVGHRQLGSLVAEDLLPLSARLGNALVSYVRYLEKTVWPANLAVYYPHPGTWPPGWVAGASAVLVGVSVWTVLARRRWPYLLTGWLWFLVTLLPAIGIIQASGQAMADRFVYVPLIGVFIMVAWGAADLRPRSRAGRLAQTLGAALVLGACLVATRFQLKHWQNSVTLFSRTLEVTTDNWLAHNNLGTALAAQGKVEEGAEHFRAVLQLNPACDDARNNLGRSLAERGQRDEAKAQIEAVLRRNPRHARAHRNLGYVLLAEGNITEGLFHYSLARQLQPDDAATPQDLAAVLTRPAEPQIAPPYLRQALDLLPSAEMRAQVASAWAGQRKFQPAVQAYRAALALQPQSPEIFNNLAWLLATCPEASVRDGGEAVRLGERACELTRFKRTLMVGTLAAAYAEAGRFAEAVATAQKARDLALASGQKELADKNQQLLVLYRTRRAYHEPLEPSPTAP
jgi:tetratricopeptide (TPR) repeat protein